MVTDVQIEQAAALLRTSRRPCVLTGAGVSKESGIPTFRDALEGLWAQYDPSELATPTAFERNPKLVWDFYEMRRERVRPAQPNPGHLALATLEKRYGALPIITQNVDDLHERAGSTQIIHLHGLIARDRCSRNCQGDPTLIDVDALGWDRSAGPPVCPHCGALIRPDVVWFGEILPEKALSDAIAVIETTDLMLVIGTSGVVHPAARMPLEAKRHGAKLIEINPFRSELTPHMDAWLEGASGAIMPRLLAALEQA